MTVKLERHERAALRRQGITAASLHEHNPTVLSQTCDLPLERCEYLVAMAEFQTLVSVGPAAAQDLWDLGCRSLGHLSQQNPVAMYDRLVAKAGGRLDPCVEDVFRCAIAQVLDPELPASLREWWNWKDQRGQPMGIPASRPHG